MINFNHAKKYIDKEEDIVKIDNYFEAVIDDSQTWVCHHKNEIVGKDADNIVLTSRQKLIEQNRYFNVPYTDLVFWPRAFHAFLHRKCEHLCKTHEMLPLLGEKIASILQQHDNEAKAFDAKSAVESTFQRRTWRCLYKVIQFIEACKWRFDKDVVSPVSSTEKVLQEAIGAAKDKNPRKRVLRVIDNAIKLGIMKCEVDYYSQKNGIAKLYSFNKQIYQKILSFYIQSPSKSKLDISSIVTASCPSQSLYDIHSHTESSGSQDIVEVEWQQADEYTREAVNVTKIR